MDKACLIEKMSNNEVVITETKEGNFKVKFTGGIYRQDLKEGEIYTCPEDDKILRVGVDSNYDTDDNEWQEENWDHQCSDDDEIMSFSGKLYSVGSIGSIIESEVNGTTYSKSKYIGSLESGHRHYSNILSWSAEERAANETVKNVRESKKDHVKSIEPLIKSLRDAMWIMTPKEKANVARYVFEQLMK